MIIEPGKKVGEYDLGSQFTKSDVEDLEVVSTEDRDRLTVYKTSSMWFFVNKQSEKLEQITIFAPCEGKVLGKVGIGDTLRDVHECLGRCVVNHKVHEPVDFPGIGFETIGGSKGKSAQIESISVSMPYVFDGVLPDHIKRNLGNKRKLP